MKLSLPPKLKRYVEKKAKSGLYANEGEVIHEALRFFRENDPAAVQEALKDGSPLAAEELVFLKDDLSALNKTRKNLREVLGEQGGIGQLSEALEILRLAAKSAREDLKAIMNDVKAINRAKDEQRRLISRMNKDIAANPGPREKKSSLDFSRGMGSEKAYHRVRMPCIDPDAEGGIQYVTTDLWAGKIDDVEELKAIQNAAKDKLDSLSEMGEMESLRLQMAMDRMSRMISALSNLLKKLDETAQDITQNLK